MASDQDCRRSHQQEATGYKVCDVSRQKYSEYYTLIYGREQGVQLKVSSSNIAFSC